jgi:hypothetical protein
MSRPSTDSAERRLEVFDSTGKFMHIVPQSAVTHLLPETAENVSRLIICRNYQPGKPESCHAGSRCKFVHVDCALTDLEAPVAVHGKYCWHHQDDCIYPRLPAGEVLRVSAPNNRMPFDYIPSDCVLATRGALNRHTHSGQLSHCAHYAFNKLCKRGADCHFIHAVVVDAQNVPEGHFSRKRGKLEPLSALQLPLVSQQHSGVQEEPSTNYQHQTTMWIFAPTIVDPWDQENHFQHQQQHAAWLDPKPIGVTHSTSFDLGSLRTAAGTSLGVPSSSSSPGESAAWLSAMSFLSSSAYFRFSSEASPSSEQQQRSTEVVYLTQLPPP